MENCRAKDSSDSWSGNGAELKALDESSTLLGTVESLDGTREASAVAVLNGEEAVVDEEDDDDDDGDGRPEMLAS